MTRPGRFAALCLLVLETALASPLSHAEAPSHKIAVQGHRGARGVFPENSLAAFDYALQIGVDALELDLVVSKDGRLVVSHDPMISKALCLTSGGKPVTADLVIHDLPLAEIETYDCGSIRNPLFPKQKLVPGSRLATLDEVFALVLGSKSAHANAVEFNIEAKSVPGHPDWAPDPSQFAKLIVAKVREFGLASRVVVQSFDHRVLREIKRLEPKLRTSALTAGNHLNYSVMAKDLGAEIVSPQWDWITAADVKSLHVGGYLVLPWTANTKEEWQTLVAMGVDGIITDYPEELLAFLASQFKDR